MKTTKTNKKETKYISGTVQYLAVGEPALIKTAAGVLQTSKVEHCIQNPSGEVWIETKHTKYHVSK